MSSLSQLGEFVTLVGNKDNLLTLVRIGSLASCIMGPVAPPELWLLHRRIYAGPLECD